MFNSTTNKLNRKTEENIHIMTRTYEIKKAADELYIGSEYPIPNIYCFMKGAQWADNHPLPIWRRFEEHTPQNGAPIIIAVVHPDFKIASYEIMRFDPIRNFPVGECVFWMPIPDIPEEQMKPLFGVTYEE